MSIYLITVLANCIHICIKLKNNILKTQLFDYAKKKLSNKQIIFLYIKIATIDENTDTYKFFKDWIETHSVKIMHKLLYIE